MAFRYNQSVYDIIGLRSNQPKSIFGLRAVHVCMLISTDVLLPGYYCEEANTTDPYQFRCPPGYYCPPGTTDANEYACSGKLTQQLKRNTSKRT